MSAFRPASAGDVAAIVALMRGYYAQDGYTFVDAEARAAALLLVTDPRLGRLWIARDGETIVGYVAVALGFSFEYRGREALEIAESYCREAGVNALHLEVERHRSNALELYKLRGFADFGRYLMTKWLTPTKPPPR